MRSWGRDEKLRDAKLDAKLVWRPPPLGWCGDCFHRHQKGIPPTVSQCGKVGRMSTESWSSISTILLPEQLADLAELTLQTCWSCVPTFRLTEWEATSMPSAIGTTRVEASRLQLLCKIHHLRWCCGALTRASMRREMSTPTIQNTSSRVTSIWPTMMSTLRSTAWYGNAILDEVTDAARESSKIPRLQKALQEFDENLMWSDWSTSTGIILWVDLRAISFQAGILLRPRAPSSRASMPSATWLAKRRCADCQAWHRILLRSSCSELLQLRQRDHDMHRVLKGCIAAMANTCRA